MKTPMQVNSMELVSSCVSINISQWEEYMEGTTKANGKTIRNLIKKHLPELYDDLCLQFNNPYESNSVKKKGLLVYVHSGIEYFIEFN